jgi:hypothetical protein
MTDDIDQRIQLIADFKQKLLDWEKSRDIHARAWLNQNTHRVEREVNEAGCARRVTITPPPSVGGLVMQSVNPFVMMFDRPYMLRVVPTIVDMLDQTIGVLQNSLPEPKRDPAVDIKIDIQRGYAFVAMPMDPNDPALVDVLEAIKAATSECGIVAERIDDDDRSERITNRTIESIRKAEFVIVDLTNERPDVFFEAGYAHGFGKLPIYVARDGTDLHFNLKDYPVIRFRNMKELREKLVNRLRTIADERSAE